MDEQERIVDYSKWCEKCVHEKKAEVDIPCFDCLDTPINLNTDKPIHFEEKKGK